MENRQSDRDVLHEWADAHVAPGDSSYKRMIRAQIVLGVEGHFPFAAVALYVQVSPRTVVKWWTRYVEEGVTGLLDRPRRGAPRRISEDRVAELIRQVSAETPVGARPWSCRSLARATGLSRSSVHRIWQKWKADSSGGGNRA